jgi:hypothetical protein
MFSRFGTSFVMLFFLSLLFPLALNGQEVKEYSFQTKGGGAVVLQKEVPREEDPRVKGMGKPVRLYVVQLARFEFMREIPQEFPKGTLLYVNPDHPSEKILLGGFYNSFEEAEKACLVWKKQRQFKKAFPRELPFIVRYE